jgi:hypothetical protein
VVLELVVGVEAQLPVLQPYVQGSMSMGVRECKLGHHRDPEVARPFARFSPPSRRHRLEELVRVAGRSFIFEPLRTLEGPLGVPAGDQPPLPGEQLDGLEAQDSNSLSLAPFDVAIRAPGADAEGGGKADTAFVGLAFRLLVRSEQVLQHRVAQSGAVATKRLHELGGLLGPACQLEPTEPLRLGKSRQLDHL